MSHGCVRAKNKRFITRGLIKIPQSFLDSFERKKTGFGQMFGERWWSRNGEQ